MTTTQQPTATVHQAPPPAAAPAPKQPRATATRPERVRVAAGSAIAILFLIFLNGSTFAVKGLRTEFGETGGWIAYAALVAAFLLAVFLISRARLKSAGHRRNNPSSGGLFGGGGKGGGLGSLFNPRSWGGRGRAGSRTPGRGTAAGSGSGGSGKGRKPGLLSKLRDALPKGVPGSTKGRKNKDGTSGGGAGNGKGSSTISPKGKGGRRNRGGSDGTGSGPDKNGAGANKKKPGFLDGWNGFWDKRAKDKAAAEKAAAAQAKKAEADAKKASSDKPKTAGTATGADGRRPSPHPRADASGTGGSTTQTQGRSQPVAAARGRADNDGGLGSEDGAYSFVAWLLKGVPRAARTVTPRRAKVSRIRQQAAEVYRVPAPLQAALDEMDQMFRAFEALTGELPGQAVTSSQHREYLDAYERPAGGSPNAQATRDVQAYKEGGGS